MKITLTNIFSENVIQEFFLAYHYSLNILFMTRNSFSNDNALKCISWGIEIVCSQVTICKWFTLFCYWYNRKYRQHVPVKLFIIYHLNYSCLGWASVSNKRVVISRAECCIFSRKNVLLYLPQYPCAWLCKCSLYCMLLLLFSVFWH